MDSQDSKDESIRTALKGCSGQKPELLITETLILHWLRDKFPEASFARVAKQPAFGRPAGIGRRNHVRERQLRALAPDTLSN